MVRWVYNSNVDDNALVTAEDGAQAHAQINAFGDTWTLALEAAPEYPEVLHQGHQPASNGRVVKGRYKSLRIRYTLVRTSALVRRAR